MLAAGAVFLALGAVLVSLDQPWAAAVSVVGGLALVIQSRAQRRRYWAHVWVLAAQDRHPIQVLAIYEHLSRMRFRDLLTVDAWFTHCEARGLPHDSPDAPESVKDLLGLLGITPV